jgi:uncharacterized membrane protein YfhO
MYMAILLPAGKHTVKLTYITPGIKQGLVVSGGGIVCFIGIMTANRIRSRSKRKNILKLKVSKEQKD